LTICCALRRSSQASHVKIGGVKCEWKKLRLWRGLADVVRLVSCYFITNVCTYILEREMCCGLKDKRICEQRCPYEEKHRYNFEEAE